MKNEFRTLGMKILANGKIEGHEVESLRELISADGKIDRQEAEFLLDLYRRTDPIAPAFEKFFYKVIKQHLLADGTIDSERATWLRKLIFSDGRLSERESKLLRELRGEAKEISVEGQALFEECLDSSASSKK
jgi:uncharacterized tellurite resistance protein B-like protein